MTIRQWENKLRRSMRDEIIKQAGVDKTEFTLARSKIAGVWHYVIQAYNKDAGERIAKVEVDGMRTTALSAVIVSFSYVDDEFSKKEVFVKEEKDELQTEISA